MDIEIFYGKLYESEWGKKYLQLIREPVPEGSQTEVHHIQPRALGGTNSFTNLVRLSVYQHIIVHIYLAKALPCKETLLPITWMSRKSVKKLTDLEKISLEQIQEWTELREQASRESSKLIHNPEALQKSIKKSQETRKQKYGSCTAYLHTKEVREKALNTVAAKYNGDRAGQFHTEEARNRVYKTRLERYGTRGPVLTEEARKKAIENSKKTTLERYGKLGHAENFRNSDVHRRAVENSRKTRTEMYGSPTGAMNNPESVEKARISRNRKIKQKQEIRKSLEFQEWWKIHQHEYKNSWYAVGHYMKEL